MKSPFSIARLSVPFPFAVQRKFAAALLAGALACASPAAHSVTWSIVDLGTLGGPETAALGINDLGAVLGYSMVADGQPHAFMYRNGVMRDLSNSPTAVNFALAVNNAGRGVGYHSASFGTRDFPAIFQGGAVTVLSQQPGRARGINNAGAIVGEALLGPQGENRAFLYQHGKMTALGTLGGSSSSATAINNGGLVVGGSATAGDATSHAVAYGRQGIADLGTLGGTFSMAYAVNDRQDVAGESTTANGDSHAFLWRKQRMFDLGTLGGNFSRALGINNFGQVVGFSNTAADPGTRAFLYSGGAMIDLNSLPAVQAAGWFLSSANAINNAGQIVGAGIINGQNRAFLLSPWPAIVRRGQHPDDDCDDD